MFDCTDCIGILCSFSGELVLLTFVGLVLLVLNGVFDYREAG